MAPARRRRRRQSPWFLDYRITGPLLVVVMLGSLSAQQAAALVTVVLLVAIAGGSFLLWRFQRRRADRAAAAANLVSGAALWPDRLTWRQLEEVTAQLLRRDGWDARTTVGGADRGIDVEAYRPHVKLCAQCKQQAMPAGGPKMQQLVGALASSRANRGMFVCPSGFTARAREEAALHDIVLVDRALLARWARNEWRVS